MSSIEPHDIVPDDVDLETIRQRQSGTSTGERLACPNPDCGCDFDHPTRSERPHGSLVIQRRNFGRGDNGAAYRCTYCDTFFDEPVRVEVLDA